MTYTVVYTAFTQAGHWVYESNMQKSAHDGPADLAVTVDWCLQREAAALSGTADLMQQREHVVQALLAGDLGRLAGGHR